MTIRLPHSKSRSKIAKILTENRLFKKIRGLGIKRDDLLDLLSSPLYSPDEGISMFPINVQRFKANKKHLRSLLLKTAKEIKDIIKPLPEGMVAKLIAPSIDIDGLYVTLLAFASCLKPSPDMSEVIRSFFEFIDKPTKGKRGRPAITSARDHRIWQLASLIKKYSGSPHYDLVAEIMNHVYEYTFTDTEVKKIISRHPEERTFYPTGLAHTAPTKVISRTKWPSGPVHLYSPPAPQPTDKKNSSQPS